ncbi:MAG: ABC transporter permease [Eubacteriales bacterium]|nr:ABC transporter permease [Eubacteriales bacterium]
MRWLDLLRMSLSSLFKRKVRTVLTVLGVVIGTASIVVMISLGLGLNKSATDQIEEYGGLTTIRVQEGRGGSSSYSGGATVVFSASSSSSKDQVMRLDDASLEVLGSLSHVKSVSPILQINVIAKYGAYLNDYMQVKGMTQEGLEGLGFEIGEGTLPQPGSELTFFYGNMVAADFYNPKTYDYPYYSTGEAPVDFTKDTVFFIFDRDAYYATQNSGGSQQTGAGSGSGDNSGNGSQQPPKKYLIPTAGVEKAAEDGSWGMNSSSVYCDLDTLKATLKRIFRNKAIPGQPTTSSGKPYKEIYYSQVDVSVDDIDHVMEVQEQIKALGYEAYSNIEWLEATQEQYANIQAMLGGIGAVSLLVAAIGITNTMMMSIYERTKEIGVMKVLGCDMRNIQAMFLMEAAYIGLLGGIIGLGLSYGISAVINKVVAASGNMATLSLIPPWLAGAAVVFAIVIGMAAGFFPSRRAMKLSPLAAIRNE